MSYGFDDRNTFSGRNRVHGQRKTHLSETNIFHVSLRVRKTFKILCFYIRIASELDRTELVHNNRQILNSFQTIVDIP